MAIATPMYWFIMAPYKSPPFGSCAIYLHHSVGAKRKLDNFIPQVEGDFCLTIFETTFPRL